MNDVYLYQQFKQIFGEENLQVEYNHPPESEEFTYIPIRSGIDFLGWIGVRNEKLTEESKQLIQLFDASSAIMYSPDKKENTFWQRAIQEEMEDWISAWEGLEYSADTEFGLIFITIDSQKEDWTSDVHKQFQEMIEAVVEQSTFLIPLKQGHFLWILPHYSEIKSELIEVVKGLVDTLAAELVLKANFFIDQPVTMPMELREYVQNQLSIVQACNQSHVRGGVVFIRDVLHLYLLKQSSNMDRKKYVHQIMGQILHDSEAIETARVYFQENLNISEAAKKLFIHRNSMQYRLDKFAEKTGYDLRRFEHSVVVYLAIQALGMLNKE
ncbi:PucR family transcriptional regulator [Bacillus horti]